MKLKKYEHKNNIQNVASSKKIKLKFLVVMILIGYMAQAQPWVGPVSTNRIPKAVSGYTFTNSALLDDGSGSIISAHPHYTFSTTTSVINWGGGSGDLLFRTLSTAGTYTSGFNTRMVITYTGNVGINTTSPSQRLDVNGNARLRVVPTVTANYLMTGVQQSVANDILFSKLAFTGSTSDVLLGDGTWGSLPGANNGLSVFATNIQLGQNCNQSGAPAALTNSREIPMASKNIYFTGQGIPSNTESSIAMGYAACVPLPAKLSILQENSAPISATTTAASFINRDQLSTSPGTMTAVEAITDGVQGGNNSNIAGRFTAENAPMNYGVYTSATGATGSNYGIYAVANSAPGANWAGWFQGDVRVNGNGLINTAWVVSDKRYKKNIKALENTTEKLTKLSGYSYLFKTEEFKDKNFSEKEQIGFIAQELKEVFPQLVYEDEKGYLAVNYQGMVPILVEAFKEQQAQIDELKSLIKEQSASGNNTTALQTVELNDAQSIVLEQNVPNPFAEQTAIHYTLTDDVQKAQLLFYNQDGKLINSIELKPAPGKGQVNVFAEDLTNGMYTYSLIVNGKVIDTKKMMKVK